MKKFIVFSVLIGIFEIGFSSCDSSKKKAPKKEQGQQTLHKKSKEGGLSKSGITSKIKSTVVSNKVSNIIETDILNWKNNKVLVEAIKKANTQNAQRTLDQIKAADEKWRSVKGVDETIKSYMTNSAAQFLKEVQKKSKGLYSEIFIMDFQGCNVALTNKTSDFWQGDEAKFKESYNEGKGKIFIDKAKFDDSTQSNLTQVSLPITDPNTKKVVGAITIGINIDKL